MLKYHCEPSYESIVLRSYAARQGMDGYLVPLMIFGRLSRATTSRSLLLYCGSVFNDFFTISICVKVGGTLSNELEV